MRFGMKAQAGLARFFSCLGNCSKSAAYAKV
nr:MAG TPA: hypothetical protein [Caudoviricetes sp.]